DPDVQVRTAAATAIGKLKARPNPLASKEDSGKSDSDAPAPSKASILSGPAEHWFLSADVLLTAKTKLANSDNGPTVQKPPEFYVGFDFLLGDLPSESRPWWGNFVLKGMIKAARRPTDSFGV